MRQIVLSSTRLVICCRSIVGIRCANLCYVAYFMDRDGGIFYPFGLVV